MLPKYLKVPVEFAQFALSRKKTTEASVYLSMLFLFPGKTQIDEDYIKRLSNHLGLSTASIYKKLKWLKGQNWIGKDETNGWLMVRGLDFVHRQEKWKYKRAVIMYPKDLKHTKAFLTGAVFLSLVVSGKQGSKTGRFTRRPEQLSGPVSLTAFSKVLGVSTSTAQRYRDYAIKYGYIKSQENLSQVLNLKQADLDLLRKTDIESIKVKFFGDGMPPVPIHISTLVKRNDGFVYHQRPNLITPKLNYKRR